MVRSPGRELGERVIQLIITKPYNLMSARIVRSLNFLAKFLSCAGWRPYANLYNIKEAALQKRTMNTHQE